MMAAGRRRQEADELRALEGAREDRFVDLEDATEEKLDEVKREIEQELGEIKAKQDEQSEDQSKEAQTSRA